MRHVLYGEDKYFDLGITGSNAIMECLTPDENGQFDSVILVDEKVSENFKALKESDFPSGNPDFFPKMHEYLASYPVGKKLLMTNQWVGTPRLMEAVKMINDGKTTKEVNDWIKATGASKL